VPAGKKNSNWLCARAADGIAASATADPTAIDNTADTFPDRVRFISLALSACQTLTA
jgi:hypothetical protein